MADDSSTTQPTANGIITPFTKLRFVSSNLPPDSIINKRATTATNSIIFNTYNGTTGIFMCDEHGFVKRITAEFDTDHFNITDNVASINSKVFDVLKRQIIDDLRRELGSVNGGSVNGGSTNNDHASSSTLTVTNIEPTSVSLSAFNKKFAETAIYVTYSGFVNASDVVNNAALRLTVKDGSVPQGLSVTIGEPKTYGTNQLRYPVTVNYLSDPKKAENTVTLQAGNIEANIGVSVTRSSDQPARVISIRADVSSLDFSSDKDAVKTVTVSKTLSPGYRDIKSLKLSATTLQNVVVDQIDYHEDNDVFHVKLDPSVSGSVNGSITIGVENTEYNTNVRNITIPVSYTAATVPATPKPTPQPTPKPVLKRIQSIAVNNGQSIEITAGTPKTVNYTVKYTGELEDSNTDNLDIASKDGVTVEISKQNKTITFTTTSDLGVKQVSFDVMSNGTNVGQFRVNVEAKRRIVLKGPALDNPMVVFNSRTTSGNSAYNDYILLTELASVEGATGTIEVKPDTFGYNAAHKDRLDVTDSLLDDKLSAVTLYVKEDPTITATFDVQHYKHPIPVLNKESLTVPTGGDPIQFTIRWSNSPACVNQSKFRYEVEWSLEGDNVGTVSNTGLFSATNAGASRLVAKVVCYWDGHKIVETTLNATITVQAVVVTPKPVPMHISSVTVNGTNVVELQAGQSKTVSYDVTYTGNTMDGTTNSIDIISKDGIDVSVNTDGRTITFTTTSDLGVKQVSFDVMSNGVNVGTVNVNVTKVERRLTLKKSIPMGVFIGRDNYLGNTYYSRNNKFYLRDLVDLSGPSGTLAIRTDDENELTADKFGTYYTINEKLVGNERLVNATIYVKEDPTVSIPIQYQVYDYPKIRIKESKEQIKLGETRTYEIEYTNNPICVNDSRFTKEVTWAILDSTGTARSGIGMITPDGTFTPNSVGECRIVVTVICKWEEYTILRHESYVPLSVVRPDAKRISRVNIQESTPISILGGTTKIINYTLELTDGVEDSKTYDVSVDNTSGPKLNGISATVNKENRTITIEAHEFAPHNDFSLNIVSNEKVVGTLPLSVDKKRHELMLNRNVGDELVMFGFNGESESGNCFSYNNVISDIVTASYGDIDVHSDALNISTDNTRRFIKTPDEDKTGDITFYIKQEPETTKTVRVKNYKHPNPYLGTNSSFGNDVTTIMGNSLDLSIWYHDEIPCIRDPKFSAIASWEVNQEFGYFMKEGKSRVQSISDVRKVEFHPHRQGTGQVTANVRCYYDGQLILEKQTSVTVNVQADPYDNYTLSGSTEKISIGQFSNTFVRRNITSVDSINQFERPQIDVKVTSGPTNGVRVSMDNNGVLTVRNALEPKYYGRTVGTVTLKLGSKSLTIPFEKVYDSPITSLSTKEFTKVVYDDDYKSEDGNIYTYIEGSIKYKDDISLPLLLEDSNGSTIRVDENDLSDIEVSFEEWGQPDKNDSLYSYWGCEIVNHGQDRFRIKVWPSNPNNDIGYESKVVVKSKVDKSKYTTAHLVFWKKNGENRFVEPTASPSPSPNPSPSPSPDPTALPESY